MNNELASERSIVSPISRLLPDDNPAANECSDASFIAVQPTLFWRPSISLSFAKWIVANDKANAFYDEARQVCERGEFRVCA